MNRRQVLQSGISLILMAGLVAALVLQTTVKTGAAPGKKIVGYAANWSVSTRAEAASLDGSKFSILIYAFIGIDVATNKCTKEWTDPEKGTVIDAIRAKAIVDGLKDNKAENTQLKVMLSIGGGGYAARFDALTNLDTFAQSCYDLMIEWGADGLDVDYEFPAAGKQQHHADIIKKLNARLNNDSAGGGPHILSVGTAASDYYGSTIYVDQVWPEVDYLTTMAYNYHGAWEWVVNYNSPLRDPSPNINCNETSTSGLCAVSTANYWVSKGVPKSKILLGLGFYGNQHATAAGCTAAPGSSSHGGITTIDYKTMRTNGMLSGGEAAGAGWSYGYSTGHENASLCNANTWIGFENPRSARARADWIKNNGYPGIMLWEVFKDHDPDGSLANGFNGEMINAICGSFTCPAGPTGPTSTASGSGGGGTLPTATRTRTNTVGGATATRTRTNTSAPPPTTSSGSCGGLPVWNANTTYSANQQVQHSNTKWTAAWTTIGETPGASGAWRNDGPCPLGGPTATRTNTSAPAAPTATRTRTNTTGAATATRTRTNTTGTTPPTATRTRTNTSVPAGDYTYGVTRISSSQIKIWFRPTIASTLVDIHYLVNGVNQQNFRMTNNAGTWEQTISGLAPGVIVQYWFTFEKYGPHYDTISYAYTQS